MNDMDFISFPPRPFHCIPRGNVFYISLLPGGIFHCLPRAIFKIFHCSLGRYFIGCLGDILFISLLPRVIFKTARGNISLLPGRYLKYFIAAWVIFNLFHCCPGRYFIGCLGRFHKYFTAIFHNYWSFQLDAFSIGFW